MFLVATTSVSVPQIPRSTGCPMRTGVFTQSPESLLSASGKREKGIGAAVFTESLSPLSVLTVVVSVLKGFVHSSYAYFFPRSQVYPETSVILPFWICTVIEQPKGQQVQIIFFSMIFTPPFRLLFQSKRIISLISFCQSYFFSDLCAAFHPVKHGVFLCAKAVFHRLKLQYTCFHIHCLS